MINSELNGIRIRRQGRYLFAGALFFLGVGSLVLQPGWAPPAMTQEQTVTLDYEITYVSTNNKQDDKLRKVKVVVSPKDGRKLNVITRQGYYGPGRKRAVDQEAGKK